jgi:hypothetical protein
MRPPSMQIHGPGIATHQEAIIPMRIDGELHGPAGFATERRAAVVPVET